MNGVSFGGWNDDGKTEDKEEVVAVGDSELDDSEWPESPDSVS
jgi:hypothetical protein